MLLYPTEKDYLFHLVTTSPQEAKNLWRKSIKTKWGECAYCGSKENLTIDHIVPRSKGGNNHITNVLCACEKCNKSKAHYEWEDWYFQQEFFEYTRHKKINSWMTQLSESELKPYKPRKNLKY
tara:strand:+ start:2300 stop:2668 length:369 start_codon:yes stop_codon:yes gene_type:complete